MFFLLLCFFHSLLGVISTHDKQILGSAYALGANAKQLTKTYEHEIRSLLPRDRGFIRGDKISKHNWRDFLNEAPFVGALDALLEATNKKTGIQ
jgi:hypothetical protein